MKKICNLPLDLAEEVLCRIPVTSLRSVRLTCRKWNTLSKDMSFAKKHLAQAKLAAEAEVKGITLVMVMYSRVYLMRFNLQKNVDESFMNREGSLNSLNGSDEFDVSQVFHCDGLLLCVTRDNTRLVVWNPYWGQTRWIEPTRGLYRLDLYAYALGYDKSSKSHKILRFLDPRYNDSVESVIYELNSDSWRVLDAPPRDWRIGYYNRGVSLKGNTYWFAAEAFVDDGFLVCFDFTRETFGPRLRLPFRAFHDDVVSLSSVRQEQLAVLFQPLGTSKMEIWVTTKIEPNEVSWSSKVFLEANIKQLFGPASFFIDEEEKVAMVFNKVVDIQNPTRDVAYIIGVDGSLKEENIRESAGEHRNARVCSYVPSLVQLN